MCKKKHTCLMDFSCASRLGLAFFLVVALVLGAGAGAASAVQKGANTLGTRSGKAQISTDPVTGDKVMRTPDAPPAEQYGGPDTIIISPEVYPNRPGVRPQPPRPQPPRPQPPRPQPPRPPQWPQPR